MTNSPCFLVIVCFVTLSAVAQDVRERSDLGLMDQQLGVIAQLAERAHSVSTDTEGARYRFDFPRFTADLERLRHGVNQYLSPSRAQPADLADLIGDYRANAPQPSTTDEHD
ncbi:RAQPRD family integrative conjugative element protein [Pseudomonas sp. NFX224]|uniref:integrative conjugative element protein, RAQPRD family n=1 Tax=Pseudomonas sp. NFX224 TaxID=3402862 RepID=UPI003AFB5263